METARRIADDLLREHLAERRAKANKVALIAELAEEYVLPAGAEVVHGRMVDALVEEVYPVGGPGAPAVSEFVPLEVAALLGISKRKASVMIDGAVHLKWQLPELFEQVSRLQIEADRAVQASYVVSSLPPELARKVVRRWVAVQERYAWSGAFKKLDEMVAEADPWRAADEAERLKDRFAKISTSSQSAGGFAAVGHVEASVDVVDAKLFDAALSQVAELLKTVQGDESSLEVRRSKAFGVLSRPAYALALIQQGASRLPDPQLPVDPADGLPMDPSDGVAAGGGEGSYWPAGCAGHTCGTVSVPLEKLLPKVEVQVVVEADAVGAAGTARIDDAVTIATKSLGEVLSGKQVKVQPVIDLPRVPEEDQYRPSVAMRRAVLAKWRAEMFPFSSTRALKLDMDHVLSWFRGGGPGQTCVDNLVPVTRRVHRAKTAGLWIIRFDDQGRGIWTSPLGYEYFVSRYGTEPVIPLQMYGRHKQH